MLPERFENDLLRSYPAGDIRRVLLSDEELATGSRLEIGRNFLGGPPERIRRRTLISTAGASPWSRISARHGRAEFPICRHQRKFRGAGINRGVGRSHHQKPRKIDMAARSQPGRDYINRRI